jgi:hypothetical protein
MPASGAVASYIDPRALGLYKPVYTANEVIESLSISRAALYKEINSKRLVAVKRDGKVIFLACDLAAYLLTLRDEAIRARGLSAASVDEAAK